MILTAWVFTGDRTAAGRLPEFRASRSRHLHRRRLLCDLQHLTGVGDRCGDDDLLTITGCGEGQLMTVDVAGGMVCGRQVQDLHGLELEGIHGCWVRCANREPPTLD